MTTFNLCEHYLIYIECLIYYLYVFSCLLLIPFRKIFKYTFVDIIGPVVYFKNSFTRITGVIAAGKYECHKEYQCHEYIFQLLHHHASFFLPARRFIIISSTRTAINIIVESGLNSGVSPPLRASE